MRNAIEELIFSDVSSYDIYVNTGVNQGLVGDIKDGYFYYLGKAKYIKGTEKQDYMPNGNSVVTMHLSMNTSIRDDIYRYIT